MIYSAKSLARPQKSTHQFSCRRWKSGHCRFGERCNFAHGELELRRRGSTNESPWSTDFARGQEGFVPSAPPLRVGQLLRSQLC